MPKYLGCESLPSLDAPAPFDVAIKLLSYIYTNILAKIIQWVKEYRVDIILVVGVALACLLSFAAGYITAKQDKIPIKFEQIENGK